MLWISRKLDLTKLYSKSELEIFGVLVRWYNYINYPTDSTLEYDILSLKIPYEDLPLYINEHYNEDIWVCIAAKWRLKIGR